MDSRHADEAPLGKEGYEPPSLVLLGTLEELTRGQPGPVGDDLLQCCSSPAPP